jgi:hypothetical protein
MSEQLIVSNERLDRSPEAQLELLLEILFKEGKCISSELYKSEEIAQEVGDAFRIRYKDLVVQAGREVENVLINCRGTDVEAAAMTTNDENEGIVVFNSEATHIVTPLKEFETRSGTCEGVVYEIEEIEELGYSVRPLLIVAASPHDFLTTTEYGLPVAKAHIINYIHVPCEGNVSIEIPVLMQKRERNKAMDKIAEYYTDKCRSFMRDILRLNAALSGGYPDRFTPLRNLELIHTVCERATWLQNTEEGEALIEVISKIVCRQRPAIISSRMYTVAYEGNRTISTLHEAKRIKGTIINHSLGLPDSPNGELMFVMECDEDMSIDNGGGKKGALYYIPTSCIEELSY